MEIGTISLLASLVVGGSQIWKFVEERSSKKEDKLAVFARKAEVDNEFKKAIAKTEEKAAEMAGSFAELQTKVNSCATILQVNAVVSDLGTTITKQAVLEERVNHSIDGLEKIEIKLDKIIERL